MAWTKEQRNRVSLREKKRWAALSVEEKTSRYRRYIANMMFSYPEVAIWPERWLADLVGGNEGSRG